MTCNRIFAYALLVMLLSAAAMAGTIYTYNTANLSPTDNFASGVYTPLGTKIIVGNDGGTPYRYVDPGNGGAMTRVALPTPVGATATTVTSVFADGTGIGTATINGQSVYVLWSGLGTASQTFRTGSFGAMSTVASAYDGNYIYATTEAGQTVRASTSGSNLQFSQVFTNGGVAGAVQTGSGLVIAGGTGGRGLFHNAAGFFTDSGSSLSFSGIDCGGVDCMFTMLDPTGSYAGGWISTSLDGDFIHQSMYYDISAGSLVALWYNGTPIEGATRTILATGSGPMIGAGNFICRPGLGCDLASNVYTELSGLTLASLPKEVRDIFANPANAAEMDLLLRGSPLGGTSPNPFGMAGGHDPSVPEPGSCGLMTLGLVLLTRKLRKRSHCG